VLKASRQKHNSWQLYSNEKNGLQQIWMESCQPIKRLRDNNNNNNNNNSLKIEASKYVEIFDTIQCFNFVFQGKWKESNLK